jgi:hypothetical protein
MHVHNRMKRIGSGEIKEHLKKTEELRRKS